MTLVVTNNAHLTLALEMLADMILSYSARQERYSVPPEDRETVLAMMDREDEEQLDAEMTAELLQTTDFRLIA